MPNGMLWIVQSGAQWREPPEAYGPWWSVYAQFAKWRKKTADKSVDRTRGGLNTKLHTVMDSLGHPVEFLLSAKNDHDSVHAVELLKESRSAGAAY